jgi:hypothetical protein
LERIINKTDKKESLMKLDDEWRKSFLLDQSVYRRKSLFRLPFNTKMGSNRPFIPYHDNQTDWNRQQKISIMVDYFINGSVVFQTLDSPLKPLKNTLLANTVKGRRIWQPDDTERVVPPSTNTFLMDIIHMVDKMLTEASKVMAVSL